MHAFGDIGFKSLVAKIVASEMYEETAGEPSKSFFKENIFNNKTMLLLTLGCLGRC